MGLKDRMGLGGDDALEVEPGDHYAAEVNKGSLNMGALSRKLNRRYTEGWRLAHVFEQDGNTVMVWERA